MAAAPPESPELTAEERLLRLGLRIFAVCSAGETLIYLLPALIGSSEGWAQLPFVAGSFVKAGMLAGLCFVARCRRPPLRAARLGAGRRARAVGGRRRCDADLGRDRPAGQVLGLDTSIETIVWGGILFEGGLAVLYGCFTAARSARATASRYLAVGQFRTLASLGRGGAGPRCRDARPRARRDERRGLPPALRRPAQVDRPPGAQRHQPLPAAAFLRQPFNLMAADERRPSSSGASAATSRGGGSARCGAGWCRA